MEKRWQFGRPDSGLIQALTEQLHISPVLAQVLANRGIADAGEASHFLHDTLADMADPFLMKGMDAAVQRLEQAITENQRIVIYGDYDVDGITSTSLVYSVLRDLGASPQFYIPERESEGYGLNEGGPGPAEPAGGSAHYRRLRHFVIRPGPEVLTGPGYDYYGSSRAAGPDSAGPGRPQSQAGRLPLSL